MPIRCWFLIQNWISDSRQNRTARFSFKPRIAFRTTEGTRQQAQQLLVSCPELHLGQQKEHDNRPNSYQFLANNYIQDNGRNRTTCPIVVSFRPRIAFRTTEGTGQQVQQLFVSCPELHLGHQKDRDNMPNSCQFPSENCILKAKMYLKLHGSLHAQHIFPRMGVKYSNVLTFLVIVFSFFQSLQEENCQEKSFILYTFSRKKIIAIIFL